MIKPKLTKYEVQKAMETACENCTKFDDCEEAHSHHECLFAKLYSRILQEFE